MELALLRRHIKLLRAFFRNEETALIWHLRMGHTNIKILCEMRDAGIDKS